MGGKLLQDGRHDASAFFLMLHFPSSKEYGHLNLVIIAQELQGVRRLCFDVVVARFGPDAYFFDLLLTGLGALFVLVRIVEAHFAVIEDAADRRAIIRRDFDKVEIGRPG